MTGQAGPDDAELASIVRGYCPDADPADVATLIERTRADGRIKNPAAWLHGKGKSGSLGNKLSWIREQRVRAEQAGLISERRQGPPCPDGMPGGLAPHPVTGLPLCPVCRSEGRSAVAVDAAALGEQGELDAGERAPQPYRLVMTPASEIRPRPVRWGWQGRIPAGAVSLIAGREGIGKSLLLAGKIAAVTRGTLPGAFCGQPRPVFYAATEDSWHHSIAPRLIAADADLSLVYRIAVEQIQTATSVELTLPRHCDVLAEAITEHGVALLALDPLMSVIDYQVDIYNDRAMRSVLEPLGRLAEQTGCMVIGLAHFNKSDGKDALTLVIGSRAFTTFVRAVLAVALDPQAGDGTAVITQIKNSYGRRDLPSLSYVIRSVDIDTDEGPANVGVIEFTGESERTVEQILAEAARPGAGSAENDAAEWLRECLSQGRQRSADVLAAAADNGYSRSTIMRMRKKLGVISRPSSTGPEGKAEWWMWLPGQASDDS